MTRPVGKYSPNDFVPPGIKRDRSLAHFIHPSLRLGFASAAVLCASLANQNAQLRSPKWHSESQTYTY